MSLPFSPLEEQKLTEFRLKVQDVLKTEEHQDDYFLIRWLRARNLDISKAEEMLRKNLKWREDNQVDGILDREDIPDKYKKIYPTGLFGQDKEGCPVIMLPLGRFNHKIFIEAEGLSQTLRYNIIWVEKIMKIVKETEKSLGKKGLQLVELVDMENYSYGELMYKPGLEFMYQTQKAFDENYPEMLKSLVIINAPTVFAMLYSIMKPLMAKETLDKMNVYGPDEKTWIPVIKERFNMDMVPPRWGGNLKGSDPFCSQEVGTWPDGPIPLGYFTRDIVDDQGFKTVKVGARDKLKLEFDIQIKGAVLKWSFKTDNHDIGFQVVDPEGTTLVAWARNTTQEESIPCTQLGVYLILFDNSFSFTKSKTLHYRVDVVVPPAVENSIDISSASG